MKSKSLQTLKRNAEREGLEWRQIDKDLAYRNLKLDLRKFER